MREIKFRGKSVDNGKWVYGYYHFDDSGEFFDAHYITTNHDLDVIEVDPKTVGQYTGLQDGKEIYEGDIAKSSHRIHDGNKTHINVIQFKDFCWRLVAYSDSYRVADLPLGIYARQPGSIVVIGNIHDNPELLEAPHDR